MPRFFFHLNGETDADGFNTSGSLAAKCHAHCLEIASFANLSGTPWSLIVTDEEAITVIELPAPAGALE